MQTVTNNIESVNTIPAKMQVYNLTFKWSISNHAETMGYNVCTMTAKNVITKEGAQTSCNGGGYDMYGTCLGSWVSKVFKLELLRNLIPYYYNLSFKDSIRVNKDGCYGLSHIATKDGNFVPHVDGACGWESVCSILNALGYEIKETTKNPRSYRHNKTFILSPKLPA